MEDNLNDNDLDSVFRNIIDPAESGPSEDFWKKAFGEILEKENIAFRWQVLKWKTIAYAAGAAVFLLCLYFVFVQNKINGIEQKVVALEHLQKNIPVTSENPGLVTVGTAPSSFNSYPVNVTKNDIAREEMNVSTPNNYAPIKNPIASGNTISPDAKSNTSIFSDTTANNDLAGGVIIQKDSTGMSFSSPKGSKEQPGVYMNSADHDSLPQHVDSTISGMIASSSIGETGSRNSQKVNVSKRSLISRLFVSAFFSPQVADDQLRDNNPSDNLEVSDIKAREDDHFIFSTGVRVGYEITPHWALLTGGLYQESAFSIKPTIVYAGAQSGQVQYSIVTSSGIVNFMNKKMPSNVGDSLKVSGNSSRNYICVPLLLRYNFNPDKRLNFYVSGGLIARIIAYTNTELHWISSTLNEGDVTVSAIEDLDKLNIDYDISAGVSYRLRKRISVFAEPDLQGSFSAINSDAPIKLYPFYFGITSGVTYHF